MRGAALLAAEVDAVLSGTRSERTALRRYEQARRREFGARFGMAKLLQRGLRTSGVADLTIGLLGRWPQLCDLVLGVTGDYVPPAGLLSPGLWRSLLRTKIDVVRPKTPAGPGLAGR
jgi:hypothetical protein